MSSHPHSLPAEAAISISINVNGVATRIAPMTLADWVATQNVEPTLLATAVNGEFVARHARAARLLKDGDVVMSFQPIQGG